MTGKPVRSGRPGRPRVRPGRKPMSGDERPKKIHPDPEKTKKKEEDE